jgi:hypothetical protein
MAWIVGISGSRGVYWVNGESDAPAAEEQRAPANGWCELLRHWLATCLEGGERAQAGLCGTHELRRLENVLATGVITLEGVI